MYSIKGEIFQSFIDIFTIFDIFFKKTRIKQAYKNQIFNLQLTLSCCI